MFIWLSIALLVSAFTGPDAYIHIDGEFNRKSPTFAKKQDNIDSVTICYNKSGTKPEFIVNMARTECARFNKIAEFRRQTLNVCPLFIPVAVVYDCVGG